MKTGSVDTSAIIISTFPMAGLRQRFQGVADRTELGVVITFPA